MCVEDDPARDLAQAERLASEFRRVLDRDVTVWDVRRGYAWVHWMGQELVLYDVDLALGVLSAFEAGSCSEDASDLVVDLESSGAYLTNLAQSGWWEFLPRT